MITMTHRLALFFEAIARWFRRRPRNRKMLVLGGVKAGKSRHAVEAFAKYPVVTRITPGSIFDDADSLSAVELELEEFPHWQTLHTADLAGAIRQATHPVLIDCLGTWLGHVLADSGAWKDSPDWETRLDERLEDFVQAWAEASVPVLAISNEVGSGVMPATAAGRLFRDALGTLNTQVASTAHEVVLLVAGRAFRS